MSDGTHIGPVVIRGGVVNESNDVILCWVQDDGDPEIFELGPNRRSPSDRDVDAVKAVGPSKLNSSAGWFKFGDHNTALVGGKARDLELDFRFGSPRLSDALTDEQMLQLGGTDAGMIERFRERGSAIWWGERLS
jgi:hypothetical protein